MKKILLAVSLLIILGLLISFSHIARSNTSTQQIVTPLIKNNTAPHKRIVGFLPYWQMSAIETLRFDLLSEVLFFGVHIDEYGKIAKEDTQRLTTDSFATLQRKAGQQTHIAIVLVLQDNEKIELFLKDPSRWPGLSDNLIGLAKAYNLSGVNVDFEYSGIPARETIQSFSSFVETMSSNLKKENPHLLVSIDITADAIRKSRLYDVEKLAKIADYIVLMGYDFYRPNSSVAGPVAPLVGKELYEYDVTTAVLDFLSAVPKEKLILGVPYYGWDFPTVDDTRGSSVEKRPDETVALSTYKRNRRLLEGGNVSVHLDTDSQTPFILYRDPDTQGTRQIWFEDEISLGKKYDLVNKENLAGVAIWVLGYDGEHPELWNLLGNKFR